MTVTRLPNPNARGTLSMTIVNQVLRVVTFQTYLLIPGAR